MGLKDSVQVSLNISEFESELQPAHLWQLSFIYLFIYFLLSRCYKFPDNVLETVVFEKKKHNLFFHKMIQFALLYGTKKPENFHI